ncbi:Protein C45E1.4 [Aphelenchoides avenae]|nr:Protein C45E1.4 [Aphelenchus avenae]
MWHATLQYQNVIELVKEKLASANLHPIARQTIETFIARHRPPRSVKSLLSKDDRKQIKRYHRSRDVDSILHVVRHRLAQLSPEAQQEVLAYLNPPCRDL